MFHAGSSLGTTLQRFLPARAIESSRTRLSSVPFSNLAIAAASRISAIEPGAFSIGSVVHTAHGSLLSWSFISPSRMAFGLVQHFCRTPLLGFYRDIEHCCPLHVRSSEFHRTERLLVAELPPWGFSSWQSHPPLLTGRTLDSPWTRPTSPPRALVHHLAAAAQGDFPTRFATFPALSPGSRFCGVVDRFSTARGFASARSETCPKRSVSAHNYVRSGMWLSRTGSPMSAFRRMSMSIAARLDGSIPSSWWGTTTRVVSPRKAM